VRRLGWLLLATLAVACAPLPREPLPGRPAHHAVGGFRNPDPDYRRPDAWTRLAFIVRRSVLGLLAPRRDEAPRAVPDLAAIRDGAGNPHPTVTWVGQSTLLVQLDGVNLLTDPHWSERASPLSWIGPRRRVPPGLPFEALPRIHAVLLSHDHYDHLDRPTVRRLAAVHDPVFLVPLGLAEWFRAQGLERVEELDWWQERRLGPVRVVCTPAQHWSQRALGAVDRSLWASWAVLGRERRLFFTGDTGYFGGFREIGRRLGPFDLAAVAIGAYEPAAMMRPHHLSPEDAVQAAADVGARVVLGIHWGTFDMADEPLGEPPARMLAETRRRGLAEDRAWILRIGETRRW
jgi:N-acyl-phosphatidylethanolamine-hydrolysing phospholipase D